MVSYQAWTSVFFEVAEADGAQIETIEDGAEVVSVAADVWNDRKSELSTATMAEARDVAQQEVVVS